MPFWFAFTLRLDNSNRCLFLGRVGRDELCSWNRILAHKTPWKLKPVGIFIVSKTYFPRKSDFLLLKKPPFYLKFNFIAYWVILTIFLDRFHFSSSTHSDPLRLPLPWLHLPRFFKRFLKCPRFVWTSGDRPSLTANGEFNYLPRMRQKQRNNNRNKIKVTF